MPNRITRRIEFQLEHFEGAAGVISTWSVPYTAMLLRPGVFTDIEADGMPELMGLSLKVGPCSRELAPPDPHERRQWQCAWAKDSRHSLDELQERFLQDLERE